MVRPRLPRMSLGEAEALLQGVVAMNRRQLRAGERGILQDIRAGTGGGPSRRRIRYIRNDPQERWLDIRTLRRLGGGDCEDLAAAAAAELQEQGVAAQAVILPPRVGGRTAHAVVRMPDGRIFDPSRVAGMGESWERKERRSARVGWLGADGDEVKRIQPEIAAEMSTESLLDVIPGELGEWADAAMAGAFEVLAWPVTAAEEGLKVIAGELGTMAGEAQAAGAQAAADALAALTSRVSDAALAVAEDAAAALRALLGFGPEDLLEMAHWAALGAFVIALAGLGGIVSIGLSSGGQAAIAGYGQGLGRGLAEAGRAIPALARLG